MTPNKAITILTRLSKCRTENCPEELHCGECDYGVSVDDCVEAFDVAVEALKKQIPLPVRITTSTKRCGNCGRQLSGIGNLHSERKYCVRCGFAIDWGENNDTERSRKNTVGKG